MIPKKDSAILNKKNLLDSVNQLKELNKLIVITRSENGSMAVKNNEIIGGFMASKELKQKLLSANFIEGNIEESEYYKSLNGKWKFHFSESPFQRPKDFFNIKLIIIAQHVTY